MDVLGNDSTGPGERVRPDADRSARSAARRTAPRSSSPARSSTRRTPTTTAPTPSPTRSPTTARPTASADPKSDTATVSVTVTEVNDAPDGGQRQRDASPRTDTCSSTSTCGQRLHRPGQRVRPDADRSARSAARRTEPLIIRPATVTVHAERRLQRHRLLHLHRHRQRHDQRRRRSARATTGTVNVTVTEVNDAPTAVADSKTIAEDGTLSFPASDLTANDSAGPANESGTDPDRDRPSIRSRVRRTAPSRSSPARSPTRRTPDFNGLATVQLHGAGQRHDKRRSGLQDRNRLRQRHRHRGQRRPDGRPTTRSTVAEDGTRSIPASDLTANDSTGPANESGQTLTVTAVGSATHGTVSLIGGTITLHADADFNGPTSFTLHRSPTTARPTASPIR